jgi:hypothetical protein
VVRCRGTLESIDYPDPSFFHFPLPHAFVEREGERLPIGNLVHYGRFLLLAGGNGQAWVEAAAVVAAETGIPITAGTVGVIGCDYIDVRAARTRFREISPDGAVLVRPDRRIAFRSLTRGRRPAHRVTPNAVGGFVHRADMTDTSG